MLVEIWERFRGYDHWVPTEAVIESSQMEDHFVQSRNGPVHRYVSADRLVWTDAQGNRHTDDCEVSDDSRLYQLVGGEHVAIRYNPANPDEYYFRELLEARIHNNLFGVLTVVLFVALILVPVLLFFHVFESKL
jgi:hypothetical protein